jgi:hypothetical protein
LAGALLLVPRQLGSLETVPIPKQPLKLEAQALAELLGPPVYEDELLAAYRRR